MSRLIITFESVDVHQPQPWPIGVDDENIVTSGLGPDDGATLVGFGPLGAQRVEVFASAIREHPERAVGLAPTFINTGVFEWGMRVAEVTVHQ